VLVQAEPVERADQLDRSVDRVLADIGERPVCRAPGDVHPGVDVPRLDRADAQAGGLERDRAPRLELEGDGARAAAATLLVDGQGEGDL
jgi:hypothetical protein